MKNNIKFFVLGFVFCLVFGSVAFGLAQANNVFFSEFPIKINGENYKAEMPVLNYEGRTYLALREFGTVTNNNIDFIDNTIIINNSNYVEKKDFYNLNDVYSYKKDKSDYTLQITGIKETSDRNQFSDKNPAQVFIIDYTYTNNSGESLYISSSDFKIIDAKGEVGDTYPNSTSKNPTYIPAGTTCKAQMCLCIYNKSDNVKLYYYDNMFLEHDAIFNLNVK